MVYVVPAVSVDPPIVRVPPRYKPALPEAPRGMVVWASEAIAINAPAAAAGSMS